MVRIKLKSDYPFSKMNTPYGLVTHEWKDFRDGVYIYKEMEVEGLIQPEPQPIRVMEPTPILVESIKEQIKVEEKPVILKKKLITKRR